MVIPIWEPLRATNTRKPQLADDGRSETVVVVDEGSFYGTSALCTSSYKLTYLSVTAEIA